MKQIIQDFKTGEMKILDLPTPKLEKGFVLVNNHFSVVSVGTERGTVATAQKNMIGKAIARPDLVQQVIKQVQKKGLKETVGKVKSKLDSYKALGYSSAGKVLAVGEGIDHIKEGDLVACAGSGYASHAEIVSVPINLVSKVPDHVKCEHAAFTTVGSIALQGVRQTPINLGDNVAVIGLGLIGLITVQLLKASGVSVFGIDLNDFVLSKGKELGCDGIANSSDDNIIEQCRSFTKELGFDSVIVTASSKSSQPVELAGEITRDRGNVVLVGAVNMDFPRQPYYDKELNIKMSRSYGPGRYDTDYEEKGKDYPVGYVRWTENRNMSAFLDLIEKNIVTLDPLVTHNFTVDEAEKAYELVTGKADETPLGILIRYNQDLELQTNSKIETPKEAKLKTSVFSVGMLGAGGFAQTYLLPEIIKQKEIKISGIVTGHGYTANKVAEKYSVENYSTEPEKLLADDSINTVFIATRHNLHCKYLLEALKNNKSVYLEKPLALNLAELKEVAVYLNSIKETPVFTLGYNRRYSDLIKNLKSQIDKRHSPLSLNYRINAGYLPDDHWTKDREIGGGRIIGEVCHFVDLISYLTNSLPKKVFASSINMDTLNIQLEYHDDSIANISYWANGNDKVSKEYLEVFSEGESFILNDFTKLQIYSGKKMTKQAAKGGRDIGRSQVIKNFFDSLSNNKFPIEIKDLLTTSLTTILIEESIKTGKSFNINLDTLLANE